MRFKGTGLLSPTVSM